MGLSRKKMDDHGRNSAQIVSYGYFLHHSDSIINRRHTMIHQYDVFSERVIWRLIQEDLPEIKSEITQLSN